MVSHTSDDVRDMCQRKFLNPKHLEEIFIMDDETRDVNDDEEKKARMCSLVHHRRTSLVHDATTNDNRVFAARRRRKTLA